MNDIKTIMLWFPINILNTIIFIIFIIILYFVWKYFTKQKEVKKEENKTNFLKVKSLDDYMKKLDNLEQNYLEEKKDIFYWKLMNIFKEIFYFKTKKDISKLTLSEIKNIKLNQKLINLIENIYFKEYAKQIDDSTEYRKNLILEIKKLIK